jgi:hypothetical protein
VAARGAACPWLLWASLVDGCCWLSRRIRGHPWEYRADFGALHSDVHWQREAVPECDDARPQREPLWEYHGRAVKRVNLAPFSRDVPILAALVLHPRRARSDWEGDVSWNESADVVPQTGLDLRAVVTAAAAGQQHCGERQRSGQEDQANTERTFVDRLDSPTSVLTTRCKYSGYYLAPAKAEETREESPASTTFGSYGMSGIRSTLIRVAVIVARSPPATRLPLGSNRSEIATAV